MPPSKSENKERTRILKASEFSGDLNAFLEQYTYQPELTGRLDNLQSIEIGQSLINEIVLWKVNRYVKVNDEIIGKIEGLKVLKAGEHRKSKEILKALMELDGVDLAMASTVFRFINPRVFQIIDRHAYRAVYGKKYPLHQSTSSDQKVSLYFDYIDQLIDFCGRKRLRFITIDRLLYIFDKRNNGRL